MKLPEKSPFTDRAESTLDENQDSHSPHRLNIRPRGVDGHVDSEVADLPPPMLRRTGSLPGFESNAGHSKRRRHRESNRASRPGAKPRTKRNWTIVIVIGVLAILFSTNFMVGRFFYEAGLAEGIQRAIDVHTVTADGSNPFIAKSNQAMAALLNLRDSKPDRASTEMLALLALQTLSETPDQGLPSYLSQGHTTAEDFCAAYVAMRLGDFGKAAAILRATEPTIPADFFNYLMNDPVMRRFAKEPRVMGFYEKS
ncbi:MAG: hypothetical protein WCG66_07100 [bacterium]